MTGLILPWPAAPAEVVSEVHSHCLINAITTLFISFCKATIVDCDIPGDSFDKLLIEYQFEVMYDLFSYVPYRGKHWRGETLANLANDHKFAKV